MPALLEDGRSAAVLEGLTAGPEQGVIEEARRRQRLRRGRATLGGLAVIAGIAGVGLVLSAGGSSAGRRHSARLERAGIAYSRAAKRSRFDVRLSPVLTGGSYGWCVAVKEKGDTFAEADGECGTAPVVSRPLATELTIGSAKSDRESIVVLSTPRVAAVEVNGRRRVATVAPAGLPYGLRVARIVIPLPRRAGSLGVKSSFTSLRSPKLAALNARGQVIPDTVVREPAGIVNRSGRGPCALHAAGVPGLAAQWSHLAGAIRPFPGKLVGRAFFSCIDTEYYLRHWPIDAAILLDAAHPGAQPAAIPGLTPVPGARGYFNGPGDFKGELTATRVGRTWLVVAGGSGLLQRLDVLRHLTPTVKL